MNKCAESAEEVYAKFFGTFIESFAVINVRACTACTSHKSDWCNRNTFVDDRYAKLFFNILSDFYKIAGLFHNLIVDFCAGTFHI